MVQWDHKGLQDQMALRDHQEQSVSLALLDYRVFLEHQLALPDVMDPWDPLDLPAVKAHLEMLDHPDPQVSLVLQVSQLLPAVPPPAPWFVPTHAFDPVRRHVAVANA